MNSRKASRRMATRVDYISIAGRYLLYDPAFVSGNAPPVNDQRPSARMLVPEIKEDSSPIKNATKLAISCGCPARPQRGWTPFATTSHVSPSSGSISVATRPGMTPVTRIRGAFSMAADFTKLLRKALDAA